MTRLLMLLNIIINATKMATAAGNPILKPDAPNNLYILHVNEYFFFVGIMVSELL